MTEKYKRKIYNYFEEIDDYIEIITFSNKSSYKGEYRIKVDKDEFYNNLINYYWSVSKKGKNKGNVYACTSKSKNHKYMKMHRLICNVINDNEVVVDHKNGKTLDNRRKNLKVTTIKNNNRNIKIKNKNGEIKGVKFLNDIKGGRWRAIWYDETGKKRNKNYSVKKYGYENAKNKAIRKRINELKKLNYEFQEDDIDNYKKIIKIKVKRI